MLTYQVNLDQGTKTFKKVSGRMNLNYNVLLSAISHLLKTDLVWFMFICSINRCDSHDSVLYNASLCNRI